MHHPTLFNAVLAAVIFCAGCGVVVMILALFTAKPDPNDDEKNRGKVISFVDEKGRFHYEDEPKMKVK